MMDRRDTWRTSVGTDDWISDIMDVSIVSHISVQCRRHSKIDYIYSFHELVGITSTRKGTFIWQDPRVWVKGDRLTIQKFKLRDGSGSSESRTPEGGKRVR